MPPDSTGSSPNWARSRFAPGRCRAGCTSGSPTTPERMTDLAKATRERLAAAATIAAPAVIRDTTASDGTRKWLFDVGAGNAVESVYIPEDDRGTLCVSSQAGCALDCAFCSTGRQGFNRNLTTAEIVGQLWHANRTLLADGIQAPWVEQGRAPITNVVMMGMGEPLANYDNVVPALQAVPRRQRLRPVATSRDAVHLRARADDRPPRRRLPGGARGEPARAQRRLARPARADQPQAPAEGSSWPRACATCRTRRATSSRSST